MFEYFHNASLKQENNSDFSWLAFRFEAFLTQRLTVWLMHITSTN